MIPEIRVSESMIKAATETLREFDKMSEAGHYILFETVRQAIPEMFKAMVKASAKESR